MSFKDLLTNYLNKSGVISEGDLCKYTSPSLLAPDVKLIMPDKCSLCGIGIGTSMQFDNGVWKEFKHIHSKYNEIPYKDTILKVCDWCLEDLNKKPNKTQYLNNLMKGKK